MKLLSLIISLVLSHLALAGTLSGTIKLKRVSEAAKQGSGHGDAVIYVTGFRSKNQGGKVQMNQKNKAFVPDVMVAVKGQTVQFKNSDKVHHNVFSVSKSNPFDLGMTAPGDAPEMKLTKPGKLNVYCNIHPEMVGTLLVLPNNAYSTSSESGSYKIENVPAGTYKVYAWHRLGKPIKKEVTIKESGSVKLNWEMELTKKALPHKNKFGRPYRKRGRY